MDSIEVHRLFIKPNISVCDIESSGEINIYPNPTDRFINLNSEKEKIAKFVRKSSYACSNWMEPEKNDGEVKKRTSPPILFYL